MLYTKYLEYLDIFYTIQNISLYQIHQFGQKIQQLEQLDTSNSLVVSLQLSPNTSVKDILDLLNRQQEEINVNIKHKNLRQSAQRALSITQKLVQQLTKIEVPGLYVFCADIGGSIVETAIQSIAPVKEMFFFLDSFFHVDQLKLENRLAPIYGYSVLDGKSGICALYCGKYQQVVSKFVQEKPQGGKPEKGQQHEKADPKVLLRQMQDMMLRSFCANGKPTIDGLIVGGSAQLKNQLVNDLDSKLKAILIGVVDVSQSVEQGLHQAFAKSQTLIQQYVTDQESKQVDDFLSEYSKAKNTHVCGLLDVYHCLQLGAVQRLLIVEQNTWFIEFYVTPENETLAKFSSQGKEVLANVGDYSNAVLQERMELQQYYLKQEEEAGIEISFIKGLSQKAQLFRDGHGGIGAVLRYAVDSSELTKVLSEQ